MAAKKAKPTAKNPPERDQDSPSPGSDPGDHADLVSSSDSRPAMGTNSPDAAPLALPAEADEEICHWAVLYPITDLISAKTFDRENTVNSILEVAIQLTGGEAGFIATHDSQRELVTRASFHADPMAVLEDEAITELTRQALEQNATLITENVSLGRAFVRPGAASVVVAPLKLRLRRRPEIRQERRQFAQPPLVKQIGVLVVACAPGKAPPSEFKSVMRLYAEHATAMLINAELYHTATHDRGTAFAMRRELDSILRVELTLAEHQNTPLALLMVGIETQRDASYDLPRVRSERVVERTARVIRSSLRETDTCVRYGTQEFVIILPNVDESGAHTTAEKLREAVANFPGYGSGLRVSASIGVSTFPYHATHAEELLRKADQALYVAKLEGSERSLVWSRDIPNYALRADRLMGIITGEQSKDYRNVMTLLDTIVAVNLITDRGTLLQRIVDMMIELTDTERGMILLHQGPGNLEVEVCQDAHMNAVEAKSYAVSSAERALEIGDVVWHMGAGTETGQAQAGSGANAKNEQIDDEVRSLGLRTMISVALPVKDQVIGVLYLDSTRISANFAESDLVFLRALSRQIGTAIENARLYALSLQRKAEAEDLNVVLSEEVKRQATELTSLEKNLSEVTLRHNYENIVGKSRPMREIFQLLDKITDSNVPVLIQGETGTGKELIARALHFNSPRKESPFVTVNCSAISETLLESELFGHVKGAFTGADQDKKGLFEQADGGTIFLDEIQDMSRGMQRELLRVIQERELRRVGGKQIIKVNVRVVSAANRNLKELLQKGEFRQDLYFRLNVVSIEMPALRKRKEDIPLLVQFCLRELAQREGRVVTIDKAAQRKLLRHDWPGNVRELENCLEKSALMLDGDCIGEDDIFLDGEGADSDMPSWFDMSYKEAKEAFLRDYLCHVLTRNNGNVTRASQESGIVRSSFHKIMRKHGLSARDFYSVR